MNIALKNFYQKMKAYFWVLVFLLTVFIWSLWFSLLNIIWLSDLWMNLAGSALFLILTIVVIEVIIEKIKKQEWLKVHEVAQEDLKRLSNLLASYMLFPFGFSILKYSPNILEVAKNNAKSSKLIEKMVSDAREADLEKIMISFTEDDWQRLFMNLALIKKEIDAILDLYLTLLPPRILSVILKIRQSFNKFHLIFSLSNELLLFPESKWPENKNGVKANKELRFIQISNLKDDLKIYLQDVSLLITLVNKTNI